MKWKTSNRAAILTTIGAWIPGRLSEGHKVKILASRICSLCALDSRLLPDGSRGWIRLRVVHRRLSEDAYRFREAPLPLVFPPLCHQLISLSIDISWSPPPSSSFSRTALITTWSSMEILFDARWMNKWSIFIECTWHTHLGWNFTRITSSVACRLYENLYSF